MRFRRLTHGLAVGLLAPSLALVPVNGSANADDKPSPPLEAPEAELAKALHCDGGLTKSGKTPILFIPGTTAKGEENFAWNYMAELKKKGHPACWVNYPGRGYKDMQISAEYVVYAARTVYAMGGRKISMIGHSQGGLQAAWVMRFWPDLAAKVDDVVTLGAPFRGVRLANLCYLVTGITGCPASVLQFTHNSNWSKALIAGEKPMPAGPSYTSIYSTADELAAPGKEVSALPGAEHVGVQDVCPGRFWPEHLGLAIDLVTYKLVLDALEHPGPTDSRRVDRADCATLSMPLDIPGLAKLLPGLLDLPVEVLIRSQPWVRQEPPLRAYARQS